MPHRLRPGLLLLAALAAAGPALAQGSAPNQGVTTPQPAPAPSGDPPAPRPGELTSGTPRTDPGASPTRTDGGTTANTPLPRTSNTEPAGDQPQSERVPGRN